MKSLKHLLKKGEVTEISSMCTVFAESEVISLIGQGTPRENIAFGVVESVVTKVVQLASQIESENYILTGGFCENEYFIKRLSKKLESEVNSNSNSRYAGAIGAAIYANMGRE